SLTGPILFSNNFMDICGKTDQPTTIINLCRTPTNCSIPILAIRLMSFVRTVSAKPWSRAENRMRSKRLYRFGAYVSIVVTINYIAIGKPISKSAAAREKYVDTPLPYGAAKWILFFITSFGIWLPAWRVIFGPTTSGTWNLWKRLFGRPTGGEMVCLIRTTALHRV